MCGDGELGHNANQYVYRTICSKPNTSGTGSGPARWLISGTKGFEEGSLSERYQPENGDAKHNIFLEVLGTNGTINRIMSKRKKKAPCLINIWLRTVKKPNTVHLLGNRGYENSFLENQNQEMCKCARHVVKVLKQLEFWSLFSQYLHFMASKEHVNKTSHSYKQKLTELPKNTGMRGQRKN